MEPRPSTLQPDDNDDDEEQPSNCSIRGGGGGHTAAAAAVLDRRAHSRISSGAIPKRSHSDRGEGHRHQDPRVPSATKSPPSGSGKVATGTGSPWSSTTTAPSRFKYSPRKLEDDGDTPPRSTPGSSFQRFDSTALNRGDSLLSVNKDQEQHPGGLTKEVQQWESGLQHSLTNLESSHTFSLGAIQDNSDLEYCVYGGPDEKGLAVAFAVEEDDEDMFIPAAVEFDPDAKPPIFRNRRFRLYACLILSVVLILGTAGAVAGKMLSKRTDAAGAPLVAVPYRETLGIREAIERVVGSDQLDDLSNPYSTALNWITFIDPMELTPEKANFMQRYLIAYFYYATSVEKPWSGHCNPPEQNETEDCSHSVPVDVEASEEIAESKRWLTGLDECTWAGNFCDDSGQIVAMEHGTRESNPTVPRNPSVTSFYITMLTILFYR